MITQDNLPVLSASRIKLFKRCGKQYAYRYVLNQADDKSIPALIGSAYHKAIESYYSDGKNVAATYQRFVNDSLNEWNDKGYSIKGEEWYKEMKNAGSDMVTLFKPDMFQPTALEYDFTLPFPNAENPICMIHGFIDLIDSREWVVDHKTGKKKPTVLDLTSDPQFLLYAWAYHAVHQKLPKHIYWHHARTGELLDIPIQDQFQERLEMLQEDITAMIATQTYSRRPYDTQICVRECSFFHECYGRFE